MELDFLTFVLNHPVLIAVFLISAYFVIVNTIKMKLSKVKMLNPAEVSLLINRENALVLDLRPRAEYDLGHVTSAVSAIETDLEKDNLGEIAKDHNKPVIVIDKDGTRTYELGEHLVKNGFTQVYALRGGIFSWQQSNLPLVKK